MMKWVLIYDTHGDDDGDDDTGDDGDDDDAESDGDEMGLDSGFGAKLLLHSPLITKGILASSLMMRRMRMRMMRVMRMMLMLRMIRMMLMNPTTQPFFVALAIFHILGNAGMW